MSNENDSWTAECWQKDGRSTLWQPATTAELLDRLSVALKDPTVGSVVVYRTPRNKA